MSKSDDMAQDVEQMFRDMAIRQAANAPRMIITGRCHFCAEACAGLFCDEGCRDDFEKVEYLKKVCRRTEFGLYSRKAALTTFSPW